MNQLNTKGKTSNRCQTREDMQPGQIRRRKIRVSRLTLDFRLAPDWWVKLHVFFSDWLKPVVRFFFANSIAQQAPNQSELVTVFDVRPEKTLSLTK